MARPPAIDLRAGERAVVASTLGGPAGLDPKLVRRVGLGVLVLLALVGAASLLRGTLGL